MLPARREIFSLVAILLVAAGLNLFGLDQNGYGNSYYAAAVKSMLTSWKNFFFVSFDPLGFVSVDKPPLGLWLQTGSARLFGFNEVSLILPQALAGVGSVAVLFIIVRRAFGSVAGLLAAAMLALSPINVVTNRSNILESLVVLAILLATWAIFKAIEQRSLGWLLASGLFLAAGFNVKGLEAWLVAPVLVLVYFLGAPLPWRIRIRNLFLLGLVTLVFSLAWITVVDLTPASQRPAVDSTFTNSEFDLTFNYNGLQRLFGEPGYGGNAPVIKHDKGDPGPIRLFQPPLGGQVSWFLPLALIGGIALVAGNFRFKRPKDQKFVVLLQPQYSLVLWGGWLLVMGAFFSVALRYNLYYMTVMVPAICALAAAGFVALWRESKNGGWRGWLLPGAFAATALEQIIIMSGYPTANSWQSPFLIGVGLIGFLILGAKQFLKPGSANYLHYAVPVIYTALLVVPLWWLSISLTPDNTGEFPASGPTPLEQGNYHVPAPDLQLVNFLTSQSSGEHVFLATSTIEDAAAVYLETNKPTMALGGFSGYTPILTATQLSERVKRGDVRFFLVPLANLSEEQYQALYAKYITSITEPFTTSYRTTNTRWVAENCRPLPPESWQTSPALLTMQLFDCKPSN